MQVNPYVFEYISIICIGATVAQSDIGSVRSPDNVIVGRTLDWMYGELNGQDPSVWNVGTSRPTCLGSD